MESQDPHHIYIVLDTSPRFRSVVCATFDLEEAKKVANLDEDYTIVQPSGKNFPSNW